MPAPWNEICAMSRLLRGMLSIPLEGSLVQLDGTILLGFTPWNTKYIPLGPAPWNSCSACLGARSDRISVKCLNLLNLGDVIPPGLASWNATFALKQPSLGILAAPSGQNLCHQGKSIPLGFNYPLSRYPTKLH